MKQQHLYTLSLFLLAALAGCERHDPDVDVLDKGVIQLEALGTDTSTKALLNQGDLEVDGMKVKVYDFLSGYSGTISGHTDGEEFVYIEDNVIYDGNATWKWPFETKSYLWTRTGVHKFFGWLMEDPNNAGFKTESFFDTYQTDFGGIGKYLDLTKVLTASSPQYDFLYSEVNSVTASTRTSEIVPLEMKHLFGAFAFTVKNESTADITIKSITVPNFPVSGHTRIDYTGSSVVLPSQIKANDPVAVSGTHFFENAFSNTLLNKKVEGTPSKEYDIFTGNEVTGGNYNYRLVWPVTLETLSPLTPFTGDTSPGSGNENRVYEQSDSLIVLNYVVGGYETTTRLKFPRMTSTEGDPMAFSAGKKTKLTLQFLDKQIRLMFQVLPWDYEEVPMSFEVDAVNTTQLKFFDGTYSDAGKVYEADGVTKTQQIAVLNGKTIEGSFNIYTPVGAHIQIGVSGDIDYFTVTPSATTVNPEHDGGKINLKIVPNTTKPRTRDVKIKLHFSVVRNGREIDADTEINRDNYTIIMYQ